MLRVSTRCGPCEIKHERHGQQQACSSRMHSRLAESRECLTGPGCDAVYTDAALAKINFRWRTALIVRCLAPHAWQQRPHAACLERACALV